MSIYGKSDRAILKDLGRRLKRRRLEQNISQEQLGNLAGLNRTTIGDMERGASFGMLSLIQVLRGLNALEELDGFLPDPGPSPLQLARLKGKERRRASRKRNTASRELSEW